MEKKDYKKEAKEFLSSLTSEQEKELIGAFQAGYDNLIKESVDTIANLYVKLKLAQIEKDKQVQIYRDTYSSENWKNKESAYAVIKTINKEIQNELNILKAIENKGSFSSITDQYGYVYNRVPDFRQIDTTEFTFDEDNVLTIPVPKYVPEINEEEFKSKSYIFDSIRVTEDSYLISVNRYNKDAKNENNFVIVTLDQLVLIIDYYYSKAKANAILDAQKSNIRAEEHYDSLSEGQRYRYLFQANIYNSLPTTVKKKVSESEWETLNLAEREKFYKPYKRHGAKRLVSKLSENSMHGSFHRMYQDLINKEAGLVDKNGVLDSKGRYANPIVWKYWKDFAEMINFKIKDIRIQREDYSDTYKQALETSFGESNVDPILKEKYGILVKRQNGDKINPTEINQIEKSWLNIQKIFGSLKAPALKYNIKVSHSGTKLMFAMKALGVYIPKMGTIGVSNKYGAIDFESTFAHESAHFIDNFIGELNGKRYATDNYESLAGKIAFTFRNSMNKSKNDQTDYINSTKECFARAFQQYFGIKANGDNVITMNVDNNISTTGIEFYNHPNFVNLGLFKLSIAPLIEQFLKENVDVFETTIDIDGSNALTPIIEQQAVTIPIENLIEKEENIQDIIDGLAILLEDAEGSFKNELEDTIEGLKLLL